MRSATKAVGVAAPVAVVASLATALLIGGTPSTPPPSVVTPTVDATVPAGMVPQTFRWEKAEGATGYRIFLDGVMIGNVPGSWAGSTISVKCGVRHRFNVQPFNNKGLAPLAPPLYVTALAC